MTRKDTILISVVVNAGLLAILFITAVIYDTDQRVDQSEFVTPVAENKNAPSPVDPPNNLIAAYSTGDEVDNVLKYYHPPSSSPLMVDTPADVYVPEPLAVQSNAAEDEDLVQDAASSSQEQFVEVTVKKGDMLEKIARANGTTVGAIKRANQLQNERLSIGQVLKIPLKKEPQLPIIATAAKKLPAAEKKESKDAEPVYYVIKNGDNPWKIAKQFNVKFEDIVRLNNLDEDKARNLKAGDRIRVK